MRMKRFLAGFLCLCMVGTMDMPYVQAASVAAKSEPVAQESVKQDAEDAKLSEDVENQDNDQRSEAAKQTEVATDTRQQNRQRVQEAQRTRQSRPHC